MKTINLIILGLSLLIIFSCSNDKQVKLAKLLKQQTAINEKIKTLEAELKSEKKNTPVDSKDFRFVGLSVIKTDAFDHYIRVQGKLDGDLNASVFSEVPGTVTAKYADVGQKVVKGQVLAQIDDQQYQTQLASLETQYSFASDMFEKQQRLWDQKIGSEVQYLQSKTTKESLEKQISSLKQQIDKFRIKSPVDGTIEECNIKIGGLVSPDPRAAAYRVVAFKNMKVSAEVSEAYASKVKAGDRLLLSFPDINKKIETRVDFVSQYINPVNRTFLIETKIPNGVEELKANMIAIIQINDYHSDKSILVPMNVILTDQTGSYVYVVQSKENLFAAVKKPVVIGNSYNGIAEIQSGLSSGDRIISSGYQELIDGEYVRF